MLDFTLPYYGVLMVQEHPEEAPAAALPEGFSFRRWEPGLETEWAALMDRTEMMADYEAGLSYFRGEFLSRPEELPERMLFVCSPEGEMAGTASLWMGGKLGPGRCRLHWVAVDPRFEGRGIAKAMIAELLSRRERLGGPEPLYLATQTWSWRAISLYTRFGFRPYLGPQPDGWTLQNPQSTFAEENRTAWELIAGKLEHRNFRQYLRPAVPKEETV